MMPRFIGRLLLTLGLAILPTSLMRYPANWAGHKISKGARIGVSLVQANQIVMGPTSRVGHLSIIRLQRLVMRPRARIDHMNLIKGPFSIWLKERAVIGNRNTLTRAPIGVSFGPAQLRLGLLSKITAGHSVDMTSSVVFGDHTTLAGKGSQIWSHGYVHDMTGEGRYRVDGKVSFGNNVYVGAASVITGGVQLADGVIIGVGVAVAKSLTEPGMYVSAAIRHVPRPLNPDYRDDVRRVEDPLLTERVYIKSGSSD